MLYKILVYEEGIESGGYSETYEIEADTKEVAETLAYQRVIREHPDGYNWRVYRKENN